MNGSEEFATVPPSDGAPDRLTELQTNWTLIRSAHAPGPAGQAAMRDLIGRYHDAVERYLRLKLRDRNLADEVLQEFWIKLLNHKLAGADHSKGRFRDYLRTVLHRLIIDHFRGRKSQPLPPGDLSDPTMPDAEYDRVWREAVINRALGRLETYEASTPKNRYARVLNLRKAFPSASIEELTDRLAEQYGERLTPEAFRKTLQRSRAKFLELLIAEIKDGMTDPTPEAIEAEIHDLGLGTLYRRYAYDLHL
ncbi:RNA polymerase sigma factor [Tautonia sociabilis]|uniref:Sigma-70 family RNA polymerase sigma factor n=1 Tax=Tautonia sociabilis TaxID=2080755 RepID=A0A432MPC8_9BACT|nr:sigma-70 family RNA polymerase sigma factor [Tautonia sociabilis]RUL89027.1 sigma-70 family RNA polymerase sigma factor [Tautonia sociabilis]